MNLEEEKLADITQQELDDICIHMQELQTEIKQINGIIGRMYANDLITADMISEALDEKIDADDTYSLEVIYFSWGGKDTRDDEASSQFFEILETINKYK